MGGAGSVKFSVKIKTNARADEVIREGNQLSIKTKELPVEGRANKAVIRLISDYFGVPQSSVRIVSGLNSKNKIIEVKD